MSLCRKGGLKSEVVHGDAVPRSESSRSGVRAPFISFGESWPPLTAAGQNWTTLSADLGALPRFTQFRSAGVLRHNHREGSSCSRNEH